MKSAIKLWLSGIDAEREDHYSATRDVLFHKGKPVALVYRSRLSGRKHIIKVAGVHIPCSREMNELPTIDGLVPMVQNRDYALLNHALLVNKFMPIHLCWRMLGKEDNDKIGPETQRAIDRIMASAKAGRYILVKRADNKEDGGFNENLGLHLRFHEKIQSYNYYADKPTYNFIYSTNHDHDYTMAVISGVYWSIDLERLKESVLTEVNRV